MVNNDIKTRINKSYPNFTKAEKKVADYVLENPKEVLFMSITDLAEACNVGDTSVFRFCKKLKLRGYQEFKIELSLGMNAEALNDNLDKVINNKDEGDAFFEFSQRVLQKNLNSLNETHALLDSKAFHKVVTYIEQANQVYLFGVGASLYSAKTAANRFLRITPKVHCIEDSHMQAMLASMLTEDDLAIFISYSGSTKDTVYTAKLAKETGAKLVSITRYEKSLITNYSDITILCGSNEGPLDGGSAAANMSQLYLFDLMFTEYYRRQQGISKSNRVKTSKAVVEKMY